MVKVAFIGAGSVEFTRNVVTDLCAFAELHGELSEVTYEPPQCHPVGDDVVIAFTRILGSDRRTSAPVRQDLALVYEFSEGTVRRVTAYETPADALEAVERGHADA